MSFSQLGLSPELLCALSEQGYETPTPIQQQAIPVILKGQDVLAGAQTGTGKTAGFTLPMLQRLTETQASHQKPHAIRTLILTPTRELAAQVYESVEVYGRHLSLQAYVVFGGVNINPQIKRLRKGVDILVATPGRLLDLVGQKIVDLSQVEIFVLDEADRMLDMGFIPDIRRIITKLPRQRQNLLFSATFSDEIKAMAGQFLNDPVEIAVARHNTPAEAVTQVVYAVVREQKRELLSFLVGSGNWRQVLVFVRTKHGADRLSRQLQRDGIRSAALHGNKSQNARTRALSFFKDGSIAVLVATDIAARGLDIDQLPHVVNFDLPSVPEDYIHRIGRTGRAGMQGEALSLVSLEEIKQLAAIEKLLGRQIPRAVEPGFEAGFSLSTPSPSEHVRHSRHQKRKPRVKNPAGHRRPKTTNSGKKNTTKVQQGRIKSHR